MPKGMKAIVESGERVGNGWAQDGVQVGQRGFGQRLQQDEIEDAEAGVGEETVADVKEGLGFEWRSTPDNEVERYGEQQNVLEVVSENFAW